MRPICLAFKKMNSSIFQFNMLLENSTDHKGASVWVRSVAIAQAANGSTWQQIVAEFQSKQDTEATLDHATFIYHRYILALTVSAFDYAVRCSSESSDYERIVFAAKQLISQRDYQDAGGFLANSKTFRHTIDDYWPKD